MCIFVHACMCLCACPCMCTGFVCLLWCVCMGGGLEVRDQPQVSFLRSHPPCVLTQSLSLELRAQQSDKIGWLQTPGI